MEDAAFTKSESISQHTEDKTGNAPESSGEVVDDRNDTSTSKTLDQPRVDLLSDAGYSSGMFMLPERRANILQPSLSAASDNGHVPVESTSNNALHSTAETPDLLAKFGDHAEVPFSVPAAAGCAAAAAVVAAQDTSHQSKPATCVIVPNLNCASVETNSDNVSCTLGGNHGGLDIVERTAVDTDQIAIAVDVHQQSNDDCENAAVCESCFRLIPNEVIQYIFSYLSLSSLCRRVALVCRKFRTLAYDPINWTEIALVGDKHLSSYQFSELLLRAPQLRVLKLQGKYDLYEDEVLFMARCCPLLRELDLGFVYTLNADCVNHMAHLCKHLQVLNMEGCLLVDDTCIE